MRTEGLQVLGVGSCLPDRVPVDVARADGRYPPERAATSGLASISVSDHLSAAELAVEAARAALTQAGPDAVADVRTVLHSYVNGSGARFWDAAPYIALHTVGRSVPGFDVLQSCNGGLGLLELGRSLVAANGGSVLLTAGDRFDQPDVDRWTADPNGVFGDGAGALLLSGADRPGVARVLAMATGADNRLEGEQRGDGFRPVGTEPVDFEARREEYMRTAMPLREHYYAMEAVLTGVLKEVLDDGATAVDDLAFVVPVITTYPALQGILTHLVPVPVERTTWSFGRTTGHVGSADHLIGLDRVVRTAGRPGDKVLLVGGGTGFTATMVLLELTGASS